MAITTFGASRGPIGVSKSTPTGGTSLGFTPTSPASTADAFSEFSSIFGPPPSIDPSKVAAEVGRLINLNPAPPITAPVAPPTKIELPGGTFEGLRSSLFESQFAPVGRELERQAAAQDRQLAALLAQAGLADSGTGVGQRVALAEEFGRRAEAAARDISAAATATAFNAEIQVASANAQLEQQRNLANAGFNLTAQVENARNILAGNTAAANAYLAALGLSVEAATAYRNSFLSFLGIREESRLAGDRLRLEAASTMLNYQLQQRSLDLRQFEIEETADIQRLQLAVNREGNILDFKAALLAAKGGESSPSGTFALGPAGGGLAAGGTVPSIRPNVSGSNLASLGTSGGGISSAGDVRSFLNSVSPLTRFGGSNIATGTGVRPFDINASGGADRFKSLMGLPT